MDDIFLRRFATFVYYHGNEVTANNARIGQHLVSGRKHSATTTDVLWILYLNCFLECHGTREGIRVPYIKFFSGVYSPFFPRRDRVMSVIPHQNAGVGMNIRRHYQFCLARGRSFQAVCIDAEIMDLNFSSFNVCHVCQGRSFVFVERNDLDDMLVRSSDGRCVVSCSECWPLKDYSVRYKRAEESDQ